MKNVADLQKENTLLRDQLAHQKSINATLVEKIQLLLNRQFKPSSEKISPDQLGLFNEAEELVVEESNATQPEVTTVKSHERKSRPRVSIPDYYPREDIVYDISNAEKVCPHDGSELKVIGSEDHEQLDIIPAKIKVIRHVRLKYACPCCEQHVITASKPKQPIEKSIASPSLLAFVATQKYADALPLYRQTEMFKRIGIALDRTNLANWMVRCGELVQPLINLLNEHIQSQSVVHLDETTLQVLDEPGKPAQSKSYLWLAAAFGEQSACVYHYRDNRSQTVPLELLEQSVKAIMVDGYEGYQKACDTYQIKRLGCWAHARRKFVDAQKLQKKTGKADQAINFIQKLYAIEKRTKDQPPNERYRVRQQEAVPIIEKFRDWKDKSLATVLPATALGKALTYLNNQWDRLAGYLENGNYPIDNNPAERAIRPFTIGRKNWLFSKSQAGAKASANLYSLIETAKANDLNVYEYLSYIFQELPNAQSVEDIEALLPWNVTLG